MKRRCYDCNKFNWSGRMYCEKCGRYLYKGDEKQNLIKLPENIK